MTAVTSPTLPVTSAGLAPSGWLRISLLAAITGVALALPVQLTLGERALDRAIGVELASSGHGAAPELFSRAEQRGGLVVGELILGAGFAFVLAAVAVMLTRPSWLPQVRWLYIGVGAAWAVTIVPAVLLPPLPPGVESELGLGERQALYVGAIALGALTYAAATALFRVGSGRTRALVVLSLVIGLAVGSAAFPDQQSTRALPPGTLTEFRLASISGQLLFWVGITATGFLALRRVERRSRT